MIFSLGNLLTIFIVFTILIIFRALDRNNRSLEKVKRFSDKVRDSLAAVVEEKTAELKNLSIELGVNLKTGKEVLKRVGEAEASQARLAETNRQGLEALRAEFCAAVTAQVNELGASVQLSEKRVMDFG